MSGLARASWMLSLVISPINRIALAIVRTLVSVTSVILLSALLAQPATAQSFEVLHSFDSYRNGYIPTGVTMDQMGNLYGTTKGGGDCCGTVFKLSHQGSDWVVSYLYKFQGVDHEDGDWPASGVVLGADKALYGTTYFGGVDRCLNVGCGTVYKLAPPRAGFGPWTETVLHRFGEAPFIALEGSWPLAAPLFDREGNLYATTQSWISVGQGTVFKLGAKNNWNEDILWAFPDFFVGGGYPNSPVISDSTGNLYGTAQFGGYADGGTVFRLSPSKPRWKQEVLYAFTGGDDGGYPNGNLVQDAAGNLFGGASFQWSGGGGTIFELSPSGNTWSFKVLHTFPVGWQPNCCNLVLDAVGNLYGANFYGDDDLGVIFKLSPQNGGWVYTTIHQFTGADDGNNPTSLILGLDGNLYGTTYSGGVYGGGTIFKITL